MGVHDTDGVAERRAFRRGQETGAAILRAQVDFLCSSLIGEKISRYRDTYGELPEITDVADMERVLERALADVADRARQGEPEEYQ